MKPFMPTTSTIDHTSPFVSTSASDIMVATPPSVHIVSSDHAPMEAFSPRDVPSPTTLAVLDRTKLARTGIFLQGRHTQLLDVMDWQEKGEVTLVFEENSSITNPHTEL